MSKSSCIVDSNYILMDTVNDTDTYGITDFADNEKQYDDVISDDNKEVDKLLLYWKNMPQFPQKSKAWLDQRSNYIGGSEAGSVIGVNHYEPQYKFIWKKLEQPPFGSFKAVYHGNKYEDVAVMIYEWIHNVKVDEYGFLPHKEISWMGASPDGITSCYKNDGVHSSNKERVMLEIKCPTSRKINMDKNAEMFDIIPKYYYAQIQQQMETCGLEHTDFWQVKIDEYENFKAFEIDTSEECQFKNKKGQFKGAVIVILPYEVFKDVDLDILDKKTNEKIYAHAKFIQQPRLNMSVEEIKQWIIDVRNENIPDVQNEDVLKHYEIKKGYFFYKPKFWKVINGRCKRFARDREWMKKYMDIYEKMWDNVLFLRKSENLDKRNIYCNCCKKFEREKFRPNEDELKRNNESMMKLLETLKKGNKEEIDKIVNIYLTDGIESRVNEMGYIEE